MSDQDLEGLDDLWTAIERAATTGHVGANNGRIFDGCLFVTKAEWKAIEIETGPPGRWDDMTKAERLSHIPIRILANGVSEKLSDGRILMAFADTLYLLPEPSLTIPPLPRLHLDGVYIAPVRGIGYV